jgi:hypothetical protein
MAINPLALIMMAINQPALMAIIRSARQHLTQVVRDLTAHGGRRGLAVRRYPTDVHVLFGRP